MSAGEVQSDVYGGQGGQLAYTGGEPGIIGAFGVVLLAVGVIGAALLRRFTIR